MARLWLPLLVVAALLAASPRLVRGDDDDPVRFNRKTSEWLEMLRTLRTAKPADDKEAELNVERRRKILEILQIGGPKVPNVLPAVLKTLKDDPSDRVRSSAATWLGQTAKRALDDNI